MATNFYKQAAISDLFFNSEHITNGTGGFENLHQEAIDFLACLDTLEVEHPSVDAMVQDFKDRL